MTRARGPDMANTSKDGRTLYAIALGMPAADVPDAPGRLKMDITFAALAGNWRVAVDVAANSLTLPVSNARRLAPVLSSERQKTLRTLKLYAAAP